MLALVDQNPHACSSWEVSEPNWVWWTVLKVVLCNTELKTAVVAVEKHSSILHCPVPEYQMQCYASQSLQTHGSKGKIQMDLSHGSMKKKDSQKNK